MQFTTRILQQYLSITCCEVNFIATKVLSQFSFHRRLRVRVWGKPGDEVGEGREEGDEEGDREREAHFEVEECSPCLRRLLPRTVSV